MKEKKRILVVDDQKNNFELLALILDAEDYECIYAQGGVEALAAVEQSPPELLLVDVMMPGMDGFELTQRLKSDEKTANIPIILMTSLTDRDSRMRGFEVGAEEFISKPIDHVELLARIRSLLRIKTLLDQANANNALLEYEVKVRSDKLLANHAELLETHLKLKNTQQHLVQSEKMVALGQLAAGVAHEINNPIGYINSNLNSLDGYVNDLLSLLSAYEAVDDRLPMDDEVQQLMRLKEESDIEYIRSDIKELLLESQQGTNRVKTIVQDLKDFAHPGAVDWEWVNLHDGLNSTLNVVHNELKYKTEVIKEYAQLPNVQCLPSQLNQVWMNFMVNASHAISTKGKIYLRTGLEDDEHVWIEVEDTGSGIEADKLERIFEPFFTTKPIGKGTGLGLSIAFSIVEKHLGKIDIDSEVGRGTRLRVTIPITHQEETVSA